MNRDAIELAIRAIREEGDEPVIICHGDYWSMTPEQRSEHRYLVLQMDTWAEFTGRSSDDHSRPSP